MRLYNTQHPFDCGIDLHARAMDVCILNQAGETLLHRHMQTTPEAFLTVVAPYRDDIVVAVACLFTWYWLADLCTQEDIPFVLGHALYMEFALCFICTGKSDSHIKRLPAKCIPCTCDTTKRVIVDIVDRQRECAP